MSKKKLTAKQELFCKEYLVDLNATQAAIRAGYSEKTAHAIGQENLRKPTIQEYIKKHTEKRAQKVNLTVENVLQDILDTRDSAEKLERLSERLKANEMLGKYLKMFTDKVDIGGQGDNPLITKVVREIVDPKNKDT
jgi:phage terminase small subunit